MIAKSTALSVTCSTCKAEPQKPCVSDAGVALDIIHVIRAIDGARRVTATTSAETKRS